MQHHPAQGVASEAERVLAYLRAHPGFLAENPAVYDQLSPPLRVHGAGLADHMQAMLQQARRRADAAERTATETAAARRTAEDFTRRVQDAVLAMMRASDPGWLAIHELASLLRVDGARLCAETPGPPGVAAVPRGTVAAALGKRPALVRLACSPERAAGPDPLLHGEAVALAAQEALVRVPLRGGAALLALADRDATGLDGATTAALAFLGQAVAAALERPAGDSPA